MGDRASESIGSAQSATDLGTDRFAWDGVRLAKNAVMRVVRQGFDHAGTSIDAEVPRLFAKEWDSIVSNAQKVAVTGVTYRQTADSLDLLGINHVPTLLDKFGLICLEPIVEDDASRRQVRAQLKSWCAELVSVRNPMAHPPTTDLPVRDALRYLDTAARVCELVGDDESAARIHNWWQEIVEDSSQQPPPTAAVDNLPSRETITNEFVGRRDEIRTLFSWLEDPDRFVWVLAGDGGKGKTTIAYEFARQARPLVDEFGLAGTVWLSAKQRRFLDGQTVPITDPDFGDMRSALTKLLIAVGYREAQISDMADSDLKIAATDMLGEFPMLVIVDDLDSLTDEKEEAGELFSYHLPNRTGCKVLITSRRKLYGLGGATTEVPGLGESEVAVLLRKRMAALGMSVDELNARRVREITNITDGSPLYVEDLLRLASVVGLAAAVPEWSGRTGESAREYSLKRELEILTPGARAALGVVAYSEVPLGAAEVAEVLNLTLAEASELLSELQSWNLIGAPPLIDNVPRFECGKNLAKLFKRTHEGSDEELRIRNALKGLRGLSLRSSEVRPYIQQAIAMKRRGEEEQAEKTLLAADREVPNSPEILAMLGWLYANWRPTPRVTDARERFTRAEGLGGASEQMYFHWAQLEKGEREYTTAAMLLDRAIEASSAPNTFYYRLQAEAYIALGELKRTAGQSEAAEEYFRQADSLLWKSYRIETSDDVSREQRHLSRTFALLARLYSSWGKPQRRSDVLRQWAAEVPADPYHPGSRDRSAPDRARQ